MYERMVPRSFIFFAIFLLLSAFVGAQPITPPGTMDTGFGGGNAITGMILSPSGGRLQRRITIRLSTPTRGDRVTVTDENGNFAFRGLSSGEYTIVIDKEKEFEPITQPVSIIQPRGFPPTSPMVNIRLTAKSGTDAKPSVLNADLAGIPKRALELYNKGAELSKAGNLPGGIEQLKLAVAEAPNFMLAHNEMGALYLKLGDLPKAADALNEALKINPKAFAPLLNLGIVLVAQKKWAAAEPVLREAVGLKDDQPVPHYFLGQALAYLDRFDQSAVELEKAVSLGGDEMKEAHRLLAIIYSSRGEKLRAATSLETYLKLNPKTPDAEQLRRVARQFRGLEPAPATPSNTTKP